MLVISRKVDEQVRIGDEITVRILGVQGNVVRIGIDAPKSVVVHREEVFEQIAGANKQAAAQAPRALPKL